MPDDVPGPARRMAEHLTMIVRAATAGSAGLRWVSALTCMRRPNHRACRGNLVLRRVDIPSSIEWHCSNCDDDGVISGWEHTPFDLRDSDQTACSGVDVTVSAEVVHTLRGLALLDDASARIVFRARVSHDGVIILHGSEMISTSCSATSPPKPTTSTTRHGKSDSTPHSRSSTTHLRTPSVRNPAPPAAWVRLNATRHASRPSCLPEQDGDLRVGAEVVTHDDDSMAYINSRNNCFYVVAYDGIRRDESPAADYYEVVGEHAQLADQVARDEHGASLAGESGEEGAQPADAVRVEAVGRFVEQQHPWLAEQGARER